MAAVQVNERIEIRLDPERREMLCEILGSEGGRLSDLVRHGIDLAYEEFDARQRRAALEVLKSITVEDDMPEPEELSRQLGDKYGPPPEGWEP